MTKNEEHMSWRFSDDTEEREALQWLVEGVADLYPWLLLLAQRMEKLLSDQDTLAGYVARLTAAVAAISAEIADLKNQPAAAALDFSGLDAAVASVEGLEPAPAPADNPTPTS